MTIYKMVLDFSETECTEMLIEPAVWSEVNKAIKLHKEHDPKDKYRFYGALDMPDYKQFQSSNFPNVCLAMKISNPNLAASFKTLNTAAAKATVSRVALQEANARPMKNHKLNDFLASRGLKCASQVALQEAEARPLKRATNILDQDLQDLLISRGLEVVPQ